MKPKKSSKMNLKNIVKNAFTSKYVKQESGMGSPTKLRNMENDENIFN